MLTAERPTHPLPPNGHPDDLDTWAPDAPPFEQLPPSGMPHLPRASESNMPGEKQNLLKGTTSKPLNITLTPFQASISYTLARLLSLPRFNAFLCTPIGYAQFHSYLTSIEPAGKSVCELELWKDTKVLSTLLKQAGLAAKGMNNVYLEEDSASRVEMPRNVVKDLVKGLTTATQAVPGLDTPSKHLLQSLYSRDFDNFVRHRLLKHTKAQLSRCHLSAEDRGRSGIGSAYVVTNPRLADDPIVLVSPGFCELTGYTANQIIGRNCRFLQGKATSPQSVDSIRDRLEKAEEITQVVLNYRASGEPFINMVNIIPLRDLSGQLTYFIGGQTDLTRAMTTGSDLSFILPEDEALAVDMTSFSPAVQVEAREAGPDLSIVEVPATPFPEASRQASAMSGASAVTGKGSTLSATPGGSKKGEKEGGVKSLAALKRHATAALGLSKKKKDKMSGKGAATASLKPVEENRPLLAPTQQVSATMTIEKRMLDVQSTYDKLLVVKRDGQILFTTSGFLRYLGLPGTSTDDVDRSPLIYRKIVDLFVSPDAPNPSSSATKELRSKIKNAIEQAVAMSAPCSVQIRIEGSK
ncbi:hypothetical protein JCM11641_005281 [Rhodosporidiobolus odoratus]